VLGERSIAVRDFGHQKPQKPHCLGVIPNLRGDQRFQWASQRSAWFPFPELIRLHRPTYPADIIYYYWWGGTKSLGTAATFGLLYKPQTIDEGDCGAIGEMKIGRGNRSTRRKPAPAPLCPPQIPHDQTRARTPDRRGGKPATNRLSYGTAKLPTVTCCK
jgi:hypothetical protein